MDKEQKIRQLNNLKYNLNYVLIPKLRSLNSQLETSSKLVNNSYKIDDASADKNSISNTAKDINSMIGYISSNVIYSINRKIEELQFAEEE